ncbi:hypothetical protein [Hyperthermus butylicus]|uniref:hypothetical protein n=1 Tax=Hyperthermus butylicus TaxID=54248 RepID=UPI000323A10B|nr:hypothetical protein [Hyperthermus butylicus]
MTESLLLDDQQGKAKYPSLDMIEDVWIQGDKLLLKLANGKILEAPASNPAARQLYWEVKLRNRRRAFGL